MDVITNHTADVIQLEGNAGYRDKTDFPYIDVNGQPFDDSEFAYSGQQNYSFPEVDATSFPYNPVLPAGEETAKNPAWLNDPLLYHNRGDSSFQGENSLYGDFFGLDDLWTERKEVVDGMVDIYRYWIDEFGVDGFRIDTTKHVNMEFWQKWGPDILTAAHDAGIDHFFAFGEVFDQQFGPQFESEFSTKGKLQSTIDFAFQIAARDFASKSGATDSLRDFFAEDDYYTDTDSNAYAMPTFLGNHDMGRIGYFLQRVDQVGASDAELLARSQLAHALMFFVRGQPVIYYGDEQGFTGDGGDKDAREDMFANTVASYADNDLIGTDATSADDNFDETHPLFTTLQEYSAVYRDNPALRRGAQIHRVSSDGPGVYAFSRIDRDEKVEYVVALNNSESEATAAVPTFYPEGTSFERVLGVGPDVLTTGTDGDLGVTVQGLGTVIYKASVPVADSTAAPSVSLTAPQSDAVVPLDVHNWDGHEVVDRVEVAADLDTDAFAEVTFVARVDDGEYVPIGTDDNRSLPRLLRRQRASGGLDAVVRRDRQRPCRSRRVGLRVGCDGRRRRAAAARPRWPGVRDHPLQPPERRLRRPHHRRLQRLLGPSRVGRHRRDDRVDVAEAVRGRGRVRPLRLGEAQPRRRQRRLHRPQGRHQGRHGGRPLLRSVGHPGDLAQGGRRHHLHEPGGRAGLRDDSLSPTRR